MIKQNNNTINPAFQIPIIANGQIQKKKIKNNRPVICQRRLAFVLQFVQSRHIHLMRINGATPPIMQVNRIHRVFGHQ